MVRTQERIAPHHTEPDLQEALSANHLLLSRTQLPFVPPHSCPLLAWHGAVQPSGVSARRLVRGLPQIELCHVSCKLAW